MGRSSSGPGRPDLGARRLGHDGMGHVPGAFADDADQQHHADDRGRHGQQRGAPALGAAAHQAREQQLHAGAGEQRVEQRRGVNTRPGTRTPFQPGAKSYSSR